MGGDENIMVFFLNCRYHSLYLIKFQQRKDFIVRTFSDYTNRICISMSIDDSDTHILEILKDNWWDHFVSDDDLIYIVFAGLSHPARGVSKI